MAKPVVLKLRTTDPREDLRSRLDSAPVEHAEALLAGYEVLQGLYDSGVLELLRGLLGSGDRVLQDAVDVARTPGSLRLIRNIIVLLKTLSEFDPELLDGFSLALTEAMREAKKRGKEPPGFLAILNQFRSRDLRRGLVMVNSLLEAWGRDFFKEAHSVSTR
jgi:uncharacterized protein YjgD (DUF1641 family)